MAFTKRGKLKAKKQKEESIRLEKAEIALKNHNTSIKRKVNKKKEYIEIVNRMNSRFFNPSYFIRDPSGWKAKSFNIEKQLHSLIRWLYCRYPVPKFMFSIFTKPTGINRNSTSPPDEYFMWFITMGQGGSFAKEVRGLMTRKEAHIFANTRNDWPVTTNFWRAKCLMAGTTESIARLIHTKFHDYSFIWDEFVHSFCTFISKYQNDISLHDLSDVLDYIRHKHAEDVEYNLKGRTLGSIINASNEWHRQIQIARGRPGNTELVKYDIEPWEYEDTKANTLWTVKQLTTSGQLMNEGRKMHHCVGSYTGSCIAGNSFIFSMESLSPFGDVTKHLTIEVDKYGNVIQKRGKFNKKATKEEEAVFNRWVAESLM